MKEKSLYKFVEKYLKKEFGCIATYQRKGPLQVGLADVIGLRDIGGEYSGDFEIVAVEVKLGTTSFGKSLGQALGYSLFAHKCYLAINEKLSLEHKEMSARLGVGLLEIMDDKCKEILRSIQHQPIPALTLWTIDRCTPDYIRCNICGSLVYGPTAKCYTKKLSEAGNDRHFYFQIQYQDHEEKIRKHLFSKRKSKEKMRRYIYICSYCIENLKLNQKET